MKGLRQEFAAFSVSTCPVCLEHTGLYSRPAQTGLSALKAAIWLEHAAQIKVSMGQARGKTDAADAVRIGPYAVRCQDRGHLWQPARRVLVALDRLTARRARLVGVRQQLNTPLRSSEGFFTKAEQAAVAATLQALTAAVGQADQAIADLIAGDAHLALLYAPLTSVPGVGPVLATGAFRSRPDAKRYASYAGVVPFERSSDHHRGRPTLSPHANNAPGRPLGRALVPALESLLRPQSGRRQTQNTCAQQRAKQAGPLTLRLRPEKPEIMPQPLPES